MMEIDWVLIQRLNSKLSEKTTLDLSYEHADHERYIDRGIPTKNGEPVKDLKKLLSVILMEII